MSAFIPRALVSAVLAFASVSANAVDFGRTAGSFDVSSSGAATYTIPIWRPPGPNGLQPSISLSYNSQSGNGVGGVGWHLNAISSIERCPRTRYQDASAAEIQLYSLADRYCIGGNRLRLASGTYGVAGSVYYTELADYSRITAYGATPYGPESFVVEAKSGLKYEYGATANSRVDVGTGTGPAAVLRWMLNKVSDRAGNTYVVSYQKLTGFAVPDVISWTPVSFGSSTYRYEAKFNYFTRTDIDSVFQRVHDGWDLVNRYGLGSIQIKSNGTVIRKYRFSYDTSTVTSRSRLISAKECADDAETNCFLPLTFTYQTGQAGVTAGSVAAPPGSSNTIVAGRYDLNGDGKNDIVYWSSGSWYAVFGSNTGFSGPYNTGATTAGIFVDRFLPKGRAAIVGVVSGQLWSYRWDDSTSAFVANNTGLSSTQPTTSIDFDSDGMADFVYFTAGATSITVRRNTSTGSGNPSFSATFPTAQLTGNLAYGTFQNPGVGGYHSDINGDGREDVNVLIVNTGMGGGFTRTTLLLGSDFGFDVPPQSQWVNGTPPYGMTLNFNGDQCADRILSVSIQISPCSAAAATGVTMPATPKLFLDWDGDGKTDLLVDNGGTFGVYRSTGAGFSSLITTTIPSTGTFFSIDQDGDRLDDLIKVNGSAALDYWTHTASGQVPPTYATNIPDLLSNVTDGYGVSNSPNYVSTAWSNYDKGAVTSFPLQESEPKIVVALSSSSDGIGGTYNKTYFYVGARDHAQRDEFVGFQRFDETDSRNGIISRMYFEQTFPVAGMVSQTEVMQPNGVTPISRQVFTNTSTQLGTPPDTNNQRYFIYSSGNTSTQYELGGTWNGALLRTVTTANTYETTGGTLYDQTVTTTEPASGANGVNAGGSWVSRTYMPLANLLNDTSNWCMGRPQNVQQINSHNVASYGPAVTRTTEMTWNALACRPTQTKDEPSDAVLKVTTDIAYDTFGNVSSTTVTGIGMTARTTSSIYADATYTTGQFPLSVTNALGQTSTAVWDYNLGVPTSAADPNGIGVAWRYDAFGRRYGETRADGTSSSIVYADCASAGGGGYCPGTIKTLTTTTDYDNSAVPVPIGRVTTYQDSFGRTVQQFKRSMNWISTFTGTQFDALGRVTQTSAPCFATGSGCSVLFWTTTAYDLANRPTSITRPISDASITPTQTTNIYYEGLTTRISDPKLNETTKVANAVGQIARSTDAAGYYQTFDYDAFGGVKRVRDSASTPDLQTSNYNTRGMLTSRTDMDRGTWTFTPNALGETISQTDAMGQTTTSAFDPLGRLTSRVDPAGAGTSTWTWGVLGDNTANNKYVGRLRVVSNPGYSETYVYDSLSRPSTTTISADSTYQIDYTYNSMGAIDTLTYPTSTSSYRLKLQYDYQNRHLYRIRDFNAPTTEFWRADAGNTWDQIVQETLGNGLVTNRVNDAVTGWLKTIKTGTGGGTGIQDLAYTWDLAGNLASRKDVNQANLTETFVYDNLYRLGSSSLSTTGTNLTMGYDALGNITSKSDVGNYTYHATKKHQLSSTSNGWTFSYDNNGNMTSGRGITVTWTGFNYPASIAIGADTSSFSYTPDRQYWRQISNYTNGGAATTIYVGGLLEKVTTAAGTDYRHMIRAGGSSIIVSRQSTGTNFVNYVTSDHLGSSSVVTNSSGGVLANLSFDAFGKRRGSNWTGAPSSPDWTAIASSTRRGFTDHTMLDNLTLIHMNGRLQDPALGRFVSADPYVSEPGFTQSFNRYSYVYNNPLSFIDRSGFCAEGEVLVWSSNSENVDTKTSDGFKEGSVTALGVATCMAQIVVSGERPQGPQCLTSTPGMCTLGDIARYGQQTLANNTFPREEISVVRNGVFEQVPQKATEFECSDGSGYTENRPADANFNLTGVSVFIHRHPSSPSPGTQPQPGPRDGKIVNAFHIPVIGVSDVGGWVIHPGPPMRTELLFGSYGNKFDPVSYDKDLNKGGGDVNVAKKVKCHAVR